MTDATCTMCETAPIAPENGVICTACVEGVRDWCDGAVRKLAAPPGTTGVMVPTLAKFHDRWHLVYAPSVMFAMNGRRELFNMVYASAVESGANFALPAYGQYYLQQILAAVNRFQQASPPKISKLVLRF